MPRTEVVAKAIYPNAGVEAWYRAQLQGLVQKMAQDMLDRIRRAWRDGGGLAMDSAQPVKKAAGIIFRDAIGRVLLLHRTDGTGWAYPGGGIEPGETPAQAACRECSEEMGQQVFPGELQWFHVRQYYGVRFATFICDIEDPFTPTLNREHSSHCWVMPATALRDLKMHPGARKSLEVLLDDGTDMATDARPKLSTSLLLRRAMEKWGLAWRGRIDTASMRIAHDFAVKNRRATTVSMMKQLKDAGFTVKFQTTKLGRQAFDAVVAENVGLIRSIPQKFLTDVQSTVWQEVMAGGDLDKLADGIQEKYGIAHRRAALIARDQNHKAKAAIERAQRLEVGITKAYWQHSHAGKEPRPTHVKMDGEEYEIAKGMWDSDVYKLIWPGTEINCRCTDRPVIPGFK